MNLSTLLPQPTTQTEATRRDDAGRHPETTNEDWKFLDTHQALARGDTGMARIPAELSRAQEVLRPAARESGGQLFPHSDGLTRAQRYEQRTSAKDSLLAQGRAEGGERVGLTESDTLSQGSGEAQVGEVTRGNPEWHVSALRGIVYTKTVCDPSVLRRMGGTCSVPVRSVSDARCVNYTDSPSNVHETKGCGGASHRLEGKSKSFSMPVSSACEGSQGSDTLLACESNKVEVKRMDGHEAVVPDYKCIPRGTCVWENDVRVERCPAMTAKSLQGQTEKYWQQGKLCAPSTSVSPVCEGHAGTASQHVCQRREEEANQSATCCSTGPDYKCTLRGTCAWEEDVRVENSKIASAGCESKRERELKTSHKPTERMNSCSAAGFSGRVVGSEGT
jgi:hypothetical protein